MNQEIADLKEDFKDFKSDSEKLRIELNAQEFDECDLDLMEENFNGGSHNIMIDCMQKRLDKYCENIGVKDGVVLDSEHADCENMNYARYDADTDSWKCFERVRQNSTVMTVKKLCPLFVYPVPTLLNQKRFCIVQYVFYNYVLYNTNLF